MSLSKPRACVLTGAFTRLRRVSPDHCCAHSERPATLQAGGPYGGVRSTFWRHVLQHLQALANLMDVWPAVGERIFWGMKDPGRFADMADVKFKPWENLAEQDGMLRDDDNVGHAGTAVERLDAVSLSKACMGVPRRRTPLYHASKAYAVS